MNAYDAMITILDINETLEELKKNNAHTVPNMLDCKSHDLLESFRSLLIAEMKSTELKVFTNEDK
jgi:hypothetical protein